MRPIFFHAEKAGFDAETAAIAVNFFDRYCSKFFRSMQTFFEVKLAIEACLSLSLRIHDDVAMQHGNIHSGAC